MNGLCQWVAVAIVVTGVFAMVSPAVAHDAACEQMESNIESNIEHAEDVQALLDVAIFLGLEDMVEQLEAELDAIWLYIIDQIISLLQHCPDH